MSNASNIRNHLDRAAAKNGYLDAINGTTPESLIDAQMKMGALYSALGGIATRPLVSIGVGQGEELHALRTVFGPDTEVIGVDLSRSALERSAHRSENFALNVKLIEADASSLPLGAETISGLVMSAILHEIYSYNQPGGIEAYTTSIQEAARALEPGGVLYVREFASPVQEDPVHLVPVSDEARMFYDYFTTAFQIGLGNGKDAAGIEFDEEGRLVHTADLTQILLHFKNFWNDSTKGLVQIGDMDWKELSESYVIPTHDGSEYMNPTQLCDSIVEISTDSGHELELVELSLKMRKKVDLFLAQHFKIIDAHANDVTTRLLHASTPKLEATFRKK